MHVFIIGSRPNPENLVTRHPRTRCQRIALGLIVAMTLSVPSIHGQGPASEWQAKVRKYAERQEWELAMRIVEQEIARAPTDLDVRAWRARVLSWSGRLAEAETEYLEILKIANDDPDTWMGLAGVYLREGKIQEAEGAITIAENLDPGRADIHVERGRILRAASERTKAQQEFQEALKLDPADGEARTGLLSVRAEPKHELRLGQNNDLLSYTADYHDESASLLSRWTPHWTTSIAADFYQRGGDGAGKFVGSVTRQQPKWGALTIGGATAHDNSVIPKSEAFFGLDHGWRTGETGLVRAVEFIYGQHWYWYQSARILTLNGMAVIYLPQDWTFTIGATGSRSAFSGTATEWRPSGIARLEYPMLRWEERRLLGNVYFAVGTENFAAADQIGRFASQTYGGGLRFRLTARQEVTGYAGYQKRTQDRTDTSFGLGYGIFF